MNANELIHGGFYRIHDASDIAVRYDATARSFKSPYYSYPWGMFGDRVCAVGDEERYLIVHSLPITEDILKVNGFEVSYESRYRKEYSLWLCDDKYCVEYTFSKKTSANNFLRIYIDSDANVATHILDVHKLQQALALCGLNELADNFKVIKYDDKR